MKIDLTKVIGYSKESLQSRAVMRNIMLDLYPDCKREMNILLDVYESGVPREIKNQKSISETQYATYLQKIVDEYGLKDKYAAEGLNAWIDVCIAPGTSERFKKSINIPTSGGNTFGATAQPIRHEPIAAQSVRNVKDSAADFDVVVVSGGAVEIKKFRGFDSGTLTIPSDIDGKKVVGVGKEAYKACKSVSKIIVAEGVQYIENGAFSDCVSLKEVVLPSTLKRIGTEKQQNGSSRFSSLSTFGARDAGVFANTSINNILLPAMLNFLGEYTFANCTNLETIDLPNGIKVINEGTFSGCSMLKKVMLPDRLSEVASRAFSGSGIMEIQIPNSVRKLGSYAFSFCKKLNRIRLNEGLLSIERGAFQNCSSLKKIVIPSTVTSIEKGVFDITGWYQPSDRRRNGWSTTNKNSGLTIYCYAGSKGIEYAREEGYPIENAANLNS